MNVRIETVAAVCALGKSSRERPMRRPYVCAVSAPRMIVNKLPRNAPTCTTMSCEPAAW